MRGIIKSLTALMIAGVLTAGAEAKNLGSGEMATYVPIPTYGLVKGELEKSGTFCWWDIDISAKQLGGKEIRLGEVKIKSPYLCQYDKDLADYYNRINSALSFWGVTIKYKKPNLTSYLKNEAGYLNGVMRKAYDTLKGKVGANTMVFTLHYSAPNNAEWYYTGSVVSGMVISYGWQKKPTGNAIAFYYNSTAGKISDQAPKPTNRPDSLPVYDFTGSSKIEQVGNELNKNIRGGYKEEVYTSNTLVSKKYVDSKHKYDTFAETYTDTTCSGGSVTYNAATLGKGITAFEKEVVIPELQAQNKDEGIVTFYYSPTIIGVNDQVTLRKLDAICPAGYSFSCKEDQCVKFVPIKKDGTIVGYEKKTTPARVVFTVNHAITAKLTRTVRTDIVTADGKVTTIYNQDFPLPDLKYNVKLTKNMGTSYKDALNTVKNKSLSDYDCTWGQLEPYTGNTPLTGMCFVSDYKEPEPPPLPPPPPRPQPSQLQGGIVPVSANTGNTGNNSNICLGTEKFSLILGRIGDNYWKGYCKIYTLKTSFYVSDPNKVRSFKLVRAKFDDYIEVKINGKVAYVGPRGGTKLDVVTKVVPAPGILPQLGIPYIRRTFVDYGTGTGPCELSTSWDRRPNLELKSYLQPGQNNVEINVEVYGKGEGYVYFNGVAEGNVVRCLDRYCKFTLTGCQ